MDNRVFYKKVSEDVFKKISRGIALKTASELLKSDKQRFEMQLQQICEPILYQHEKFQELKYVITDDQLVISTANDVVIYMYIHSLYEHARFITRYPILVQSVCPNRAPLESVCWLPADESPVLQLHNDIWFRIAEELEIDDLRNLSLVSRGFHTLFDDPSFWRPHHTRIVKQMGSSGALFSHLSLKQQVLRYLLYIDSKETMVHMLFSPMGPILAKNLFLGYFTTAPSVALAFKNKRRRKATKLLQLRVLGKECTGYMGIGYTLPTRDISPTIWVDHLWQLRYGDLKASEDIWSNIQKDLQGFRRRFIHLMTE